MAYKFPDKYDAILGADLHIRESVPACRVDDYINAQWAKLLFIQNLCKKNCCPFLVAGDLFDHWKPSPYLLSRCIELLPRPTIMVPGQHDLQNHSLETTLKTGYNTLQQAGVVISLSGGRSAVREPFKRVFGYAYGESLLGMDVLGTSDDEKRRILLLHTLVCQSKQPWPGAEAIAAKKLLTNSNADLIVTGDNHQQFVVEIKNRVLVNPGSMMRMASDQADFEPAVFGWIAHSNKVERIPLPIEKGVVQKTSSINPGERDKRMEAYLTQMKKNFELGLSFTKNMEQYLTSNKVSESTKKHIWEAINGSQC